MTVEIIQRDRIARYYIVSTIKVTPLLHEGVESSIRYETAILYLGKDLELKELDGRFYSCHSFDEACIKHNEFLHLVADKIAEVFCKNHPI